MQSLGTFFEQTPSASSCVSQGRRGRAAALILLVTHSADAGHTTFPRPLRAAWSTRSDRLNPVGQVASIEATCGKAIRSNSRTHSLACTELCPCYHRIGPMSELTRSHSTLESCSCGGSTLSWCSSALLRRVCLLLFTVLGLLDPAHMRGLAANPLELA